MRGLFLNTLVLQFEEIGHLALPLGQIGRKALPEVGNVEGILLDAKL